MEKAFGMVVFGMGFLCMLNAVVLPDRHLFATWKSKGIEEQFGKKGLRIYYFIIGVLFMWLGKQWL